MSSQPRVLVAMSGGVDSSVCAYVLKEAGYDCVGATMRLACVHTTAQSGAKTCCSLDDIQDAQSVAERLGIPFKVIDFRDIFERRVVQRFVSTYQDGLTPNPCIDCNRFLKFGALLDYALREGFDYIATGHYARISQDDQHIWRLKRAKDASKDQSYVLYSLTQAHLPHVLLPLGDLIKERDVRRIAAEQGFSTAAKPDSQGICFVPDGNFAGFIEEREGRPLSEGDVLDTAGNVVGRHRGALRYTVGQRRGLGIAHPTPLYVNRINTQNNTITVGEDCDLLCDTLQASDWIWSAPVQEIHQLLSDAGESGMAVGAQIRYHQPEQSAHLTLCATADAAHPTVLIRFDTPQRAIAPGQAVVVYRDGVVLGGGTVMPH